ncbi:unnamed protein product [Pocillopora meandrina]|uniref:SAP domain-containing protein n=1 Tax=Pocillopora meandrina TaxID=46732 RepID=A0AAU9WFD1_9CNID|nr:unnamed protein product [Pocillopora meandrina]
MADGHVFLAPKADRFISRPRLVKTSSLPDLSKVYTDSTLVVADQINNKNMSTSVPEYGSLSSSFEMSEMAAIKNALNGRSVNSLKVKDLRDELEKRKLSKSGRKTELVKRLKESILSGSGEIQIPRHNVNQPSPRPSAVINLDDTSSSPEQQSHTCNGYKSLKDLYDRLENEVNKLKDLYRSRLTDSREIQSTCKSCQNQQRIQEENRALREQLQLMKGNLDKTKEERDSLQMVILADHLGHRVVVKSFAGATTSDMSHYVKPTLDKKPDQIILHAELVTRSDLSDSGDVDAVNKRLRKFCNQRQWHFILHDDIHSTDLNRGGLHLGETERNRDLGNPIVSHQFLPPKRGFKLASLNINSLSVHIDELRILLSDRPIDILAINETKLDDTIGDNEIHISGYESIRRDRSTNGRSGGGVCFFIRSEINYSVRSDLICEQIEISIESTTNKHTTLRYRKFKNFNSDHFRNDIGQQDWSSIESYSDPNLMWAAWKQLFLECVNKHAPFFIKRARVSKSPWITPYLKKRMHDRDILKLKASRSKDANDWLQF